jgi:hypothetical protein
MSKSAKAVGPARRCSPEDYDKAGVIAKATANWPAMHRVSVEKVNGGKSWSLGQLTAFELRALVSKRKVIVAENAIQQAGIGSSPALTRTLTSLLNPTIEFPEFDHCVGRAHPVHALPREHPCADHSTT